MLNARIKRNAQSALSVSRFCYVLFQSKLIRVRTITRATMDRMSMPREDAALQRCSHNGGHDRLHAHHTASRPGWARRERGQGDNGCKPLCGPGSIHHLSKNHTIACAKQVLAANRRPTAIAWNDTPSKNGLLSRIARGIATLRWRCFREARCGQLLVI